MKYKFRKGYSVRELKKQTVSILEKELGDAKSLILFASEKVTHKDFEDLRAKLVAVNSKLRFVKNTLFRVAAKAVKLPEGLVTDEVLKGPTGLIAIKSEDFISPIKVLKEAFGKNENVKLKIALLDKDLYEESKVLEFAAIPSKEELYAKLVGSLKSPLYRLRWSLDYNVKKLVTGLDQISKTKKE